jgi:nucleoside-diphosphate-sugar epimerase
MKTVIFGSEGNVGKRLKTLFPGAFGVDRVPGADLVASMENVDYDAEPLKSLLREADLVLHLATSANINAPDDVHYQAVIDAARLLAACQRVPVPRVLLPSSDWADPKRGWPPINVYGHSKRVFETMAAMYNYSTGKLCVAFRIGWVAKDQKELDGAPAPAMRANYWDEPRLFREVLRALDLEGVVPPP